jgi:cell wall-associated NlpC family hydrolase
MAFRNIYRTFAPAILLVTVACGGSQPISGVAPDPGSARIPEGNPTAAEADRIRTSVVEMALEAMGTPYVWGGTSENGFDCSGLIQYSYRQHGIELPRVSRAQMRAGMAVERNVGALQPGDVLGFNAESGGRITHVGLYVGENQFIHSSPRGVEMADLTTRYWRQHWVGARRFVMDGPRRRN